MLNLHIPVIYYLFLPKVSDAFLQDFVVKILYNCLPVNDIRYVIKYFLQETFQF